MARRGFVWLLLVGCAGVAGCGVLDRQAIGQMYDDLSMTAAIKRRLATEEGLGTLRHVNVSTDEDMVTLTGAVADKATRARIDRLVRNIAGHNRVINRLRVEGSATASK